MRRLKTRVLMAAAIAMPLAPLLAVAAPAAAPFAFDATPGRLPKTVVPVSYSVGIVPDIDALTFSGTESVRLQFRSATDTLVLNSLNEILHDVRLDGSRGRWLLGPIAGVLRNLGFGGHRRAGWLTVESGIERRPTRAGLG